MKYKEIPDITLKMIIEAGIIEPGTNVYANSKDEVIGTLDINGSITVILGDEKKIFPYPSGAARAFTKTSVNGWKFWRILENGKYFNLSYYKKKFEEGHNQG